MTSGSSPSPSPFGVLVVVPAFGEADHDPRCSVCDHPGRQTGHGVGLVDGRGHAAFGSLLEHRVGGVAAGSDDDVGPELLEDPVGLFQRAVQIFQRDEIVPDAFRRQLALVIGDFQRFQPESLARDQLVFHSVLRADEEDLSVRPPGLEELCHGDGGIDMSGGTAAGKDHSHADFLRNARLFTHQRETLSTTPISNICSSRAVPP